MKLEDFSEERDCKACLKIRRFCTPFGTCIVCAIDLGFSGGLEQNPNPRHTSTNARGDTTFVRCNKRCPIDHFFREPDNAMVER